jgi:hypothetical protein
MPLYPLSAWRPTRTPGFSLTHRTCREPAEGHSNDVSVLFV